MRLQLQQNHQDISICIFLLSTSGLLYFVSLVFQSFDYNSSWVFRLLVNVCGYSVILVPGYIIVKYITRTKYNDKQQKGCLWPLIKSCVYGQDGAELLPTEESKTSSSSSSSSSGGSSSSSPSFVKNAGLLLYCFAGLQVSYLIWGILQEKIMTQKYSGKSFTDSQFLVFVNRISALVIAWGYLIGFDRSKREAPLHKYSYCALSNILSSWFQYEALKFVSFPTQVLAKACKIIPVMLMGKLVSRNKYEFYEYFTAFFISIGMVLFLSGSGDYLQVSQSSKSSVAETGFSGFVILASYMVFDSFTSNWQSELFKTYRMSSVRMMAGVNLFSCLLTGVSLVQQGSLVESASFMAQNQDFIFDCIILSICSAIGQLFIYYTIEKFGAVIFVTIMTIRQALAVLLSCMIYLHPVNVVGVFGILFVFFSIFLRIYCSYRIKQLRSKKPQISSLSSTKV